MKTVAFYTLGCKLNFTETSAISQLMVTSGFQPVAFHKKADVYVINTCSVTDHADKKCRKVVNQALKISPAAYVVIVGCYAQLKPDEIANIPGVDLVLGASEKFRLTEYLADLTKTEKAIIKSKEIAEADFFVQAYSSAERTRSFLKVQDGCDYSCSFCTIPLARGKSRSDNMENIIRNVYKIAETGVKEVVLTGVNIGDYGKNISTGQKASFFDLIKELDKIREIPRFRISSIEPNLLKNEIIEFVATSDRFMPHFHMPLQSGSNKILKLMKRRYLRELYAERVANIKKLMPHCCIGVDVIVGFPGETHEDFIETYNFLNELDISYLHVFTYSERDNTEAVKLKGVVPGAERQKRNTMLRILSDKKKRAFYEQHRLQSRNVLFEMETDGEWMFGFTDNYVKVKTAYDPLLVNEIHQVNLGDFTDTGELFSSEILQCAAQPT